MLRSGVWKTTSVTNEARTSLSNTSDQSEPLVSVLMPVFNGERYLRQAVDSILAQTFSDFEFIIIDDGSTDETASILDEYNDLRIKLMNNSQNRGISYSLNRGISSALGEYIARMDCDDISCPDRLMVQVQFLDENIDIDVVGSWIEIIDENSQPTRKVIQYPCSALGLRWVTLFGCYFAHPAVMARRGFFERVGNYNETMKSLVDYELWTRSNLDSRFSNIRGVLLKYRVHESSLSAARKGLQDELGCRISQKYASQYLGRDIPLESFQLFQTPCRTQSVEIYCSSIVALYDLYRRFRQDHRLDAREIVEVNLDVANRLSQISLKNLHIPCSWLLRLAAITLVMFTLIFYSVRNKHPQPISTV